MYKYFHDGIVFPAKKQRKISDTYALLHGNRKVLRAKLRWTFSNYPQAPVPAGHPCGGSLRRSKSLTAPAGGYSDHGDPQSGSAGQASCGVDTGSRRAGRAGQPPAARAAVKTGEVCGKPAGQNRRPAAGGGSPGGRPGPARHSCRRRSTMERFASRRLHSAGMAMPSAAKTGAAASVRTSASATAPSV